MLWWSVNMRGHKDKNRLLSIIKICSERSQIRSFWSQTRKKSKESGMSLIRKSNIKTLRFTKITSHLQGIVLPVGSQNYRFITTLHKLRPNRQYFTKSPKMPPGSRYPRNKVNQSRPDHLTCRFKRRRYLHHSQIKHRWDRIRSLLR